ncbi:hypothetical protein COBT_002825 [Conglomerata obtusa]
MLPCINCNCSGDTPGKQLTPYINFKRCNITNLPYRQPIEIILKTHEDRFTEEYIHTRDGPFTIVSVPFISTVNITSIVTRSTCDSFRILPGLEVDYQNWTQMGGYEEYKLDEHFCEGFIKNNKNFREITQLNIIYISESRVNKIYYLAIKGTFVRDKQKPIIAQYEKMSTENIFKPLETFHYYV